MALALSISSCTNSGVEDKPSETGGADASQSVKADGGSGPEYTLEQYGAKKIDLKGATIGFSQSEADAASFRQAETQSIRDEADARGVKELIVTNANSELSKQISDIQEMLTRGVDAIIIAPVNSDGLDPALTAAAEKGVPVITIDRKVSNESCKDYIAFLGSDFEEQGKRAADGLAEVTGSKANVAILLGPSGNNVTDGRANGFKDQVKAKYPDIKIVAEQTANASRTEGQTVTEQLLQSNPEIDAIYAFNDEEGLGAMAAIEAAGKKPGEDVKIVSIDGTKNAVQAIVDGKYNVVIESNPRFGPLAFQTLADFYDGKGISENIIIEDGSYTKENAASDIGKSF